MKEEETKEEEGIPTADIWENELVPQMKDIIKITFLSAWGYVEWRHHSIGIYGLDLMVDSNLKMWLIEVNKAPCFAYSTEITKELVPKFMNAVAKIIISKSDKKDQNNSNVGSLELIY